MRKVINTNPGLKFDRSFNFSCVRDLFISSVFVEFKIDPCQSWPGGQRI